MAASLSRPMLGVIVAIAITTTMDACGLSAFSALPLFPLMGIFWYLEGLSRPSVGFVWGDARSAPLVCCAGRQAKALHGSRRSRILVASAVE